jgi:ribose 5-phosphate isomerase A
VTEHAPQSKSQRDRLKQEAAEAAVTWVERDMVVGLGSGSTAAFAVEALARRHRQGLRFVGIPTSEQTAAHAAAVGIPLSSFAEHQSIDLTIDGADEVERGTLHLIKGLGGALLREKIVAAASKRVAIVVDDSKLVNRLGEHTPVPVEVVPFGLEATRASLEALGASTSLRLRPSGEPFVTDGGHRIVDCRFGTLADPAELEEQLGRIVGLVESGLFIHRASSVFVADTKGVRRFDREPIGEGRAPILVLMGVSGAGKTTIAEELRARLGWPFEDGDALHPTANVEKMAAGVPLTDADRKPWLDSVESWIDGQRARNQPGIITCSALKRSYRRIIIGNRPEVQLVYLRGRPDLIAQRIANRKDHFMPARLLQSQLDTLEEPGDEENPWIVDVDRSPTQIANTIVSLLPSARGRHSSNQA